MDRRSPFNTAVVPPSAGCVTILILPVAEAAFSTNATSKLFGRICLTPFVVTTVALTETTPPVVDMISKLNTASPSLGIVIVVPVGFVDRVPSPETIETVTLDIREVSVSCALFPSLRITATGMPPS